MYSRQRLLAYLANFVSSSHAFCFLLAWTLNIPLSSSDDDDAEDGDLRLFLCFFFLFFIFFFFLLLSRELEDELDEEEEDLLDEEEDGEGDIFLFFLDKLRPLFLQLVCPSKSIVFGASLSTNSAGRLSLDCMIFADSFISTRLVSSETSAILSSRNEQGLDCVPALVYRLRNAANL